MRQYVILGAGLDTFAYRQPAWADCLRIFEVDHPASQQAKRARLQKAGIAVPSNVEFVSIDFESVSLRRGLLASSLDLGQPAFFSCLGVMVYLSEEAADAVFALVSSLPPPSEIVFTFSPPQSSLEAKEAQGQGRASLAAVVEQLGEPWRTHFEPQALAEKLQTLGFAEMETLSKEESERYFRDRSDSLRAPKHGRIARAVVRKPKEHHNG
jgi:methyltransferase (TIGR00027 family)